MDTFLGYRGPAAGPELGTIWQSSRRFSAPTKWLWRSLKNLGRPDLSSSKAVPQLKPDADRGHPDFDPAWGLTPM